MTRRHLNVVLTVLLGGIAVGALFLWFQGPSKARVERRIADLEAERKAGTLASAGGRSTQTEPVRIEGVFQAFDGRPGTSQADWPGFRGVGFRNAVEAGPALAASWPASGPPALWRVALGEGYAGPAVWRGRVYVLDYDEAQGGDVLRCFSFADGREIWRRGYRAPIKRNHGFSRTVPAVAEDFVVTLGPRCIAMAVDPQTGDYLWGQDLVAAYGTEVPLWYTGQCPLIDGEFVVLAPGGSALMVGIEGRSGKVAWQTPNPDGWKMSHSSVVPATLLGRRMYLYCAKEGVAGVSAEPADRGKLLWKTARWAHAVTSPSPLPVDDRRIFLTAGYGGGSMMLALSEADGQIVARPEFELEKTVFSCEQHTPLLHQGHLFGVLPKDAGENRAQFACLTLDGKIVWTSGKTERFGLGPFLLADGRIFVLKDDGELSLLQASTTGFELLARARVLHGREAWAPMALVDGRLLVRDFEEMACLDVRDPARLTLVKEN